MSIAGFPFLTQFAAGRYDEVTARATDVPVGSTKLRITRVRLTFSDVTASRDFSRFTAGSGTARATVSYADLSEALGTTVRYSGDGRVQATKKYTVLGTTVRPTISVKPAVVNGVLRFTGSTIEGLQDLPTQVQDALDTVFDSRYPLTDLPFDVRVRTLAVDRSGLQLRLTGKDLRYTVSR